MRILHTMLRVADLDRSLAFYTEVMGMRLLRRLEFPDGRFTLAFVGYQDEDQAAALELTHNWDVSAYDPGNGYGHLAVEVGDVLQAVEDIRARGGTIAREPAALAGGGPILAFVEDPDGYRVELLGARR